MPRGLSPALEQELGTTGVVPGWSTSVTGWELIDNWEDVPELRHPHAVAVYGKMGKDAQVRAGHRALLAPLTSPQRARWRLGREGVDPRVHAFVEDELDLRLLEAGHARHRRTGIRWARYCRESLVTKTRQGHSLFEQVYRIGEPTPDQADAGVPSVVAHLRKLAPRPAYTLADPVLERDGGLAGWKQWVNRQGATDTVTLDIDRLVVHVHDQEGANWRGESIYRPVWKHWAIRDVLIRVGAMAVERNGMGIPVVTFDETQGGNRARALQLAKAIRAGDEAAVALPAGYELTLMGVAGQVRDELPLLKYHGEMVGRGLQAMVLDLGHDAGARSLGDTFLGLLAAAQNTIADDWADEVTEFVIRDLVALNFGEDEPYPPLLHDEFSPETITWADLAAFAKAGLVIPDDELELELRRRAHLPAWPGAPDGPADNDVDDLIALPAPDPVPLEPDVPAPAPNVAVAARRRLDELTVAADALRARLAARAAAR